MSGFRFLAPPFGACRLGMFAGFVFAVTFADLLLDFLGHKIDGGVEIALAILGKQVGTGHGQAEGAGELLFGGLPMVVFKRHAGVDGKTVEVIEFIDACDDVVFDGFRQSQIVRREYQFHESIMMARVNKIQRKSFAVAGSPPPDPIFQDSASHAHDPTDSAPGGTVAIPLAVFPKERVSAL
jgi:hypothetical protein